MKATYTAGKWTLEKAGKPSAGRRRRRNQEVVKSTKGNKHTPKYYPGTPVEMLERYVWANGTPVTNGKTWKVMEFDHIVGACDGKPVRWMRVENTGGTIHGHPITLEEFRDLTKAR